jgi:hypothetical protein
MVQGALGLAESEAHEVLVAREEHRAHRDRRPAPSNNFC